LVEQSLAGIPAPFADLLAEVELVVEDWPTAAQMRAGGVSYRGELMGLYEGVPRTERSSAYGMVLPDRITIFREPILAVCSTAAEVRAEVRRTVLHEIAHHFGIDDDRLIELDAY
jgi:predicted Zn-dependent protease with MMP-like domain